MNQFEKAPASYRDETIPGSYYAIRHMPKGTKLVTVKRTPPNLLQASLVTKPLVGKRPRIKHRARTCMRVNRDINA